MRRVLIVDDCAQARDGLWALLATVPGVQVVGEAADGMEAVRQAEERRPHVVLVDAKMPLLDGLGATRRIKALQPRIRVVVLTAHAGYRQAAIAAGADAFLVKGAPEEALVQAILEDHSGREG